MPPASPSLAAHILIVDDEPALRRLMKRALSGTATLVTEASNGLEALELCRSHSFSAVVSDVRMPGMTGLELAQELRSFDPGLPVIIVSGSDERETQKAALAAGAFAFLPKPFPLFDLACHALAAVAARSLRAA